MKRFLVCLVAVAPLLLPIPAAAQDRIAVLGGVGGIFAHDPYPLEQFAEPFVNVAIQRVMKRYLVLEGDLGFWSHDARFEHGPSNVSGPSGVIGHVDGGFTSDSRKNWILGLNFLVRSTGAVRI